jgi:hypothetical protein
MQKDGKNAAMSKGPCGFAKAGGANVPCSSGVPQRNIYTSGRAQTLTKNIYSHKASTNQGGAKADLIGKR